MITKFLNINYNFNFIKLHPKLKILSIFLIILTIGFVYFKGLNKGIDFSGGMLMEVRFEKMVSLNEIRDNFSKNQINNISIQNFGSGYDIILRISQMDKNVNNELSHITSILKSYDPIFTIRRSEFVGPTISKELLNNGLIALIIAFSMIFLYITIRFNVSFAIAAIIALIHDVILSFGFYSIFKIEFNITSIAALLTIIGYSINDTVVIFDRIRENIRKYKSLKMEEILNKSINENLIRTCITSGTTILSLLALAILGGAVLESFSLGVLFGVIIGTYSSIFIAAPILKNFVKSRVI